MKALTIALVVVTGVVVTGSAIAIHNTINGIERGLKHTALEVQQLESRDIEQRYATTEEEYKRDAVANLEQLGHEFAGIPTDSVHTMRLWEDGSYQIEYTDGTSERGCLSIGLCQD